MPLPAPNLCGKAGATHIHCISYASPYVHAAYAERAEQHISCAQCGELDWYMSGGIVLDVDDSLADGRVEVKRNGEQTTVTYRRMPDVSLLCPQGATIFRSWQRRAATSHAPSRS